MNVYKICLVEDEISLNNLIKSYMEKEGYDARDTFFIDDRLENIEAAESLGIKCLLFRGDNDDLRSFLDL